MSVPTEVWNRLGMVVRQGELLVRYLEDCRNMRRLAKSELAQVRRVKNDLLNQALRRGRYSTDLQAIQ